MEYCLTFIHAMVQSVNVGPLSNYEELLYVLSDKIIFDHIINV